MTSLATLGVRVTSDGIEETDAKLKSLSKSGEAAAQSTLHLGDEAKKLISQMDPLVAKATRLDKQFQELGRLRDTGQISDDVYQHYAKGLEASAKALLNVDASQKGVVKSAGEIKQAFRQLPAQMTDVFTGLTTGQSPLMVLLQQGGQLKDSFGGIGGALRAVAGYVAGLINPLTLAAGAAGLLGTAFFKGSKESEAFSNAIILSGNRIGETISGLSDKASDVARITGGTIGKASEVLAAFAQSGKIARSQLVSITEAAINFEKAGGQAIEKTGEQFKAIAGDPLKAIIALNQQYNFLTPNTLRHIDALQRAGDKAGSAALATAEYAKALNKMASDLDTNKGVIEKAWEGIGNAARRAWDFMLGVGRSQTPEQAVLATIDNMAQIEARLAKLQSSSNRGPSQEREIAALQAGLDKQREYLRAANARVAAENQSADAAEKNAKATDLAAAAIAKASENSRKAAERLKELTAAWITQADQVSSFDPNAQDEATQKWLDGLEKTAEKYREIADPAKKYREQLEEIQRLTRTMKEDGQTPFLSAADAEKASAAVQKQMDTAQNKVGELDEYSKNAARSIQGAFSDYFFDPFSKGMDGIGESFIKILRRMVADAMAADLMRALFGKTAGGGAGGAGGFGLGGLGGLFGAFANTEFGQSFMPSVADGSSVVDLGGSISDYLGSFANTEFGQSFMPSVADGSSVVDLGGSISDYLGSFATGLDYVPKDGIAKIHKGERVMTAADNKAFMEGNMSGQESSGLNISYAPVFHVDSRSDRAAVMADMQKVAKQSNAELVDKLQRTGRI